MALPAVVRLKNALGTWEIAGRDRRAGVIPESVQLSANEWGPDTCSFTLRRSSRSNPDLRAFTECEVEVGGVTVWEGRVREAPDKGGDISVQGQGWQYHLDDDVYLRSYVHTRLPDWKDQRDAVTSILDRVGTAAGQVQSESGALVISWPKGSQMSGGQPYVGVYIDLGAADAKKVVFEMEKPSMTATGGLLDVTMRGADVEAIDAASPGFEQSVFDPVTAFTTFPTITFTNPKRFVGVRMRYLGTGITWGEDNTIRIKSIKVFRDTAYENANQSVLKASTVAADALPFAPLLNQDTSLIPSTSFSIPEFSLEGYRSPREVIQAVNAFHRFRTRLTREKRLQFGAQPAAPIYQIGGTFDFEDQSANSGEEIYNRCIVEGIGPDGSQLRGIRTSADNSLVTLIDRQGFTRTKVLPVQTGLVTTSANQIADIFLQTHKYTPLKGSFEARLGALQRVLTGAQVHPSELLLNTTELVRFPGQIDPDTGGMGRDGVIASVNYDNGTETSQVTIDNDRDNLEALLARLAVVTG